MMVRKILAAAAAAALGLSSAVWAAEPVPAPTDPYLANPALSDAQAIAPLSLDITSSEISTEPPPPPKPLMMLLQKANVAQYLEDLGIDFHGYVEGGIFFDLSQPQQNRAHTAQGFNFRKNAGTLDQVAFILDRQIDPSSDDWNVGFNVDVLFGHDAALIHGNGLGDSHTKHGLFDEHHWDLFQATVDINIPVGNGLILTGGKQESYFNIERVDPTQNMFYSHSYAFLYGRPVTETGGFLDYWFTEDFGLSVGITRGWNQAWLDNNKSPELHSRMTWHPSSHDTLLINTSIGPEAFHDDNHIWLMAEGIYIWKPTKEDTGVIDGEWAYVPAAFVANAHPQSGDWWALSGYLQHWWMPSLASSVRAEYFRDQNNLVVTSANPVPPGPGNSVTYVAVTAGLTIKPWPNNPIGRWLQIRPEIRYDWGGNQRPFDSHFGQQWVTSVDAIMEY